MLCRAVFAFKGGCLLATSAAVGATHHGPTSRQQDGKGPGWPVVCRLLVVACNRGS